MLYNHLCTFQTELGLHYFDAQWLPFQKVVSSIFLHHYSHSFIMIMAEDPPSHYKWVAEKFGKVNAARDDTYYNTFSCASGLENTTIFLKYHSGLELGIASLPYIYS